MLITDTGITIKGLEKINVKYMRKLIEKIKVKFSRKPLLAIPDVSHSASKNKDWTYKDESWRNPFCQIKETATGKVIKDYGVTVNRT